MKRVLVTHRLTENTQKRLQSITEHQIDFPLNDKLTREELLQRAKGVHGILCLTTDRIDRQVFEAAGPSLKVVSTMSVGYDHIDLAEAKQRQVVVGHTPDVLTDAVADLGVALVLLTSRRLIKAAEVARQCQWTGCQPNFMLGNQLTGKVVGILGLGRIGEGMAHRLRGFGVSRVLYSSRRPNPDAALRVCANFVDFDVLLREADVICICCSLNDSTFHLFDYDAFHMMKRSAILVNVARGDIIKQDDLVKALSNGLIKAAGLDVTSPEPLPADHPLFSLENCVILPHIGSATVEARDAMGHLAIDNVLAGIQGNPLEFPVSLH
ncbi:hypothetical protein IWQ62_000562 [Dispira parvispora]|uniref:D-glycerate dehydrogenase n=1 Tax=Dispira parvispora TaxID=1520584 RepID=A0A9W8E5X2_9FUNG|nr:hypothetical protein IWQ62_000562 [Dispira parvispora]